MIGSRHTITAHEDVVLECKGCMRVYKRYDGKIICATHTSPHTKWWFGSKCSQATHIEQPIDEDPIKEP